MYINTIFVSKFFAGPIVTETRSVPTEMNGVSGLSDGKYKLMLDLWLVSILPHGKQV